jgi:hypothetical protein
MGAAQLSFAEDRAEDRTIAHDRKWRDRKWRHMHHIRPSMAFWPEVTKLRDRKRPCPEAVLIGSRFCACPTFPRAFFLVVVTWLRMWPKVTWPSFGVPLDFACATGSCATPVVTEGHVIPWRCPWGVLYDVRVLYLAWLLELNTRVFFFFFKIFLHF